MRVMVFLTATSGERGSTPVLYLEDKPGAAPPGHPQALRWTYFATVDAGDAMLARELHRIRAAFEEGRPHISDLLPLGL